jgi:hypothetical protein
MGLRQVLAEARRSQHLSSSHVARGRPNFAICPYSFPAQDLRPNRVSQPPVFGQIGRKALSIIEEGRDPVVEGWPLGRSSGVFREHDACQ